MASVFQNVKATVAWRKHRLLADLNENESPVPDKFKRRASLSSLNTIHMSLRKRVPLKRVELNFHKTPTRESLEPRQRCQTLQTIKRTAKYAFGTMSQKIRKSCQSPAGSVVTFPAESISRSCATSSTKKRTATPQTPCCNTAASSKGTPREFDCELELVSSGICQLKRISQAFDDAIVKEERQQAISNYYYLMAQNSQSVHQSLKPSQATRRQAKKYHQYLVPR
ncbi:hypothetical protein DV515_00016179 [Chloebia gouldiae]|uniref:Protein PIMREG n=1 Tax=Chloebia gouldiae TaxID=44316 RepID=A0A3L8RTG5_CHLGU|nr:hypothetical protein DV515_00016179 [Chloebia gouldiae]